MVSGSTGKEKWNIKLGKGTYGDIATWRMS